MIGRPDMPKQPFRMLGSTHADARFTWTDSRGVTKTVVRSGRSSFVWLYYVLMKLACGTTDSVEIRWGRGRNHGPWHAITGADDAYRQVLDHYPIQRAGLKRIMDNHRRKRGMEVEA
jgi:hypothetical protein